MLFISHRCSMRVRVKGTHMIGVVKMKYSEPLASILVTCNPSSTCFTVCVYTPFQGNDVEISFGEFFRDRYIHRPCSGKIIIVRCSVNYIYCHGTLSFLVCLSCA